MFGHMIFVMTLLKHRLPNSWKFFDLLSSIFKLPFFLSFFFFKLIRRVDNMYVCKIKKDLKK